MSNKVGSSVSNDTTIQARCKCKVGRVCSRYDLPNLPRQLGTRWQTEEGASLRSLADDFNLRILQAAIEETSLNPLDGEVENIYRLLTDEDISSGNRLQSKKRLEKHGIDSDSLESNFVSYQTINRHLKLCLDIQEQHTGQSTSLTKEKAGRRIRALQNRTTAVTENTLGQLCSNDEIHLSDFEVFVDISVHCTSCGSHLPLGDVLTDEGGCECE